MPLNKTRLTMNVYQANGEPAFNWRYKFQLGRWGTEGNYHYTDDPVYFTVNSSGILTVDLFPSSLTAEGTVYRWWKIPPNTQEPPFISGWLDVPDSDLTIDLAPLLVGTDLPESTQADALAQVLGAVEVVSAMRDQVESDANRAEASATTAALYEGFRLDSLAALVADTSLTYVTGVPGSVGVGDFVEIRTEGLTFQVADPITPVVNDYPRVTSGGVKLFPVLQGNEIQIEAFGAKGDGVTDDSNAFVNALNAFPYSDGFDILLKAKNYKINNAAIYITRAIRFIAKSPIKSKLDFSSCTTVVNAPYSCHVIIVHPGNITGSSSYTTPITLPAGWVGVNGQYGGLVDVGITANPAVVDGIGLFINITATANNVIVAGANLHNIVVAGATTTLATRDGAAGPSGVDIGGNANNGVYNSLVTRSAVNGDGLHVSGSDANANHFIHADCATNKGWGINDNSLLGNTYIQPHTAANSYGAYRVRPASVNRATLLVPYTESGQGADNGGYYFELNGLAPVWGAQGVLPDKSNTKGSVDPRAITAELVGLLARTQFVVADDPQVYGSGGAYSALLKGALEVRTVDGKLLTFKRVSSAFTGLYYDNNLLMQFPNTASGERQLTRPDLPNGFSFSTSQSHKGGFSAVPTTGTHQKGAIVWNSNPTAGGYVGWVCVATGTPGAWKGFGLIEV